MSPRQMLELSRFIYVAPVLTLHLQ